MPLALRSCDERGDRAPGRVLAHQGEGADDVRGGHRGAVVGVPAVVGHRRGDRAAGGEDVEQLATVAVARRRSRRRSSRRPSPRSRCSRSRRLAPNTVVAGGDHRGHTLREEGVDPVFRGSVSQAAVFEPPPRLRLAATMFHEGCAVSRAASSSRAASGRRGRRRRTGRCRAAEAASLKRVKTCIAMMSAPGATPATGAPATPLPLPAAMPATWVPWSQRWAQCARAGRQRVDVGTVVGGRAVGAQRLLRRLARSGVRRAVLRDHPAPEERVVEVDAGVEDRHGGSGAGHPAAWACRRG